MASILWLATGCLSLLSSVLWLQSGKVVMAMAFAFGAVSYFGLGLLMRASKNSYVELTADRVEFREPMGKVVSLPNSDLVDIDKVVDKSFWTGKSTYFRIRTHEGPDVNLSSGYERMDEIAAEIRNRAAQNPPIPWEWRSAEQNV